MSTPVYKIQAFNTAEVFMPGPFFVHHWFTSEFIPVPCYMFLITGENIPPIIVDTGVMEDCPTLKNNYPEMTGVNDDPKWHVANFLEKVGLKFEDIKIILHTHLHVDHAGNDRLFPNARIVIARKEMQYSVSNIDPGYPTEYIGYLVSQLKTPGKICLFDDDFELFPGIRLSVLGGHTDGSTGIYVNTENGVACLSGDIIYSYQKQCVADPMGRPETAACYNSACECFGAMPSGNCNSLLDARRAIAKLNHTCDIILPCHDREQVEKYIEVIPN